MFLLYVCNIGFNETIIEKAVPCGVLSRLPCNTFSYIEDCKYTIRHSFLTNYYFLDLTLD